MNTTDSLISVIVPVYNCAPYLRQCVDSLLAQTYKNLEILLIDDGSTDDSPKICDEYAQRDSRIRAIHQKNSGVSPARNKGLEMAKGAYIGFVDADDFVAEDMYEYLHDLIERDHADISMCNMFLGKNGEWVASYVIDVPYQRVTKHEVFKFPSWRAVTVKLFRASAIANIRFKREVSYGEDTLFAFEVIVCSDQIAVGKEQKYYYRANNESATHQFEKKHLHHLIVEQKVMDYAKKRHLPVLYKQAQRSQLEAIGTWLKQLAVQKEANKEDIKELTQYARRNWRYFLLYPLKREKKCFVLMACIHFGCASMIYKFLRGKNQ